ncbi:ribosome-associated translation inhibitor RaiA [soil metagenome]
MEIIVQGRNLSLTDRQRADTVERVEHAGRVFDQAVDRVDVEISEATNPRRSDERFSVEFTAAVSGRMVRIEASAGTLEAALDDAFDRLTRQLRRLKERLIDRRRRSETPPVATEPVESDEIVRVKQFVMKPMTLEEATLQMDMLGHSFFFFFNADSDRHSVIYRRRDGRLGLIEPA